MKTISVRAMEWASRDVAYMLTRSPGERWKSSSAIIVDPEAVRSPLLFRSGTVFLGVAVDGVVQVQFVKPEIVLAFDGDGDFLDRIHARIPLGTGNTHRRRIVLLRFDEVIGAKPHVLALIHRGDVIHAVFADGHAGDALAVFARAQQQLVAVIEQQRAVHQRPVGFDGHFGIGAFYRPQVAAGIFDLILHTGPGREMISDFELLDAGKIDHLKVILLGSHAAGLDVVIQRLGHAGDQELIAGAAELRAHVGLFPLGGTGVTREHAHALRLKPLELRGDELIGQAADGVIAGVARRYRNRG